jgi:hypothetical protein
VKTGLKDENLGIHIIDVQAKDIIMIVVMLVAKVEIYYVVTDVLLHFIYFASKFYYLNYMNMQIE